MPHPDERLQLRRGIAPPAADVVERPHPGSESYRVREHEHSAMERPFEGRPPVPTEQQMRLMHNVSPGQPGAYPDIPTPDQRHHSRHPSGVVIQEGNVVPPSPYDDNRERMTVRPCSSTSPGYMTSVLTQTYCTFVSIEAVPATG